jgi:DNA polymerase-3 subunit beta
VEITTQGDSILINSGRTRFKLNGLPRTSSPPFRKVDFDESWRVTGAELQRLITHVSFAASTEETRPILNGVLWQLRDGEMRMVATNGHRLAKMTLPVDRPAQRPAADLIVHPRALAAGAAAVRRDAGGGGALENHLGFRSESTCRCTPG